MEQFDYKNYQRYLDGDISRNEFIEISGISRKELLALSDCGKVQTKRSYSKSRIKHDFFTKIDSEIKAYLLGFYYGDGNMRKSSSIFISVSEEDMCVLELYKEHISPTSHISVRPSRTNKRTGYTSKPMADVSICSKEICNSLVSYGMGPRKTYSGATDMSYIPDELIIHFIRGYFDSDGTVYSNEVTHRRILRSSCEEMIYRSRNYNWSIISYGDKTFLHIQKWLLEKHGIRCNIIHEKTRGAYLLIINRGDDFFKMRSILYDGATYFLKRKKDKYDGYDESTVRKQNKAVKKTSDDGTVEVYHSIHEAASKNNVSSTSIKNWIRLSRPRHGVLWEFVGNNTLN